MRTNSKILLVGILVFVFPVLFFVVTNNFFDTANTNIGTSRGQKIGILHDSLRALTQQTNGVGESVKVVADRVFSDSENYTIKQIVIFRTATTSLDVLYATSTSEGLSFEDVYTSYRETSFGEKVTFQQSDYYLSTGRVSHVFSREKVSDGYIYIFSLHDYRSVDMILKKRMRDSYYGLTAIFVFLIALAYWINQQTNWARKYTEAKNTLSERDSFTNMIAHEFRTPLTAIKGYASFLEESQTISKDELKYAQNISISTERLVLLVNDFLEVARIQSGRLPIEIIQVKLEPMLVKLTEDLRSLASERNIELKFELPPKPIIFRTDPNRVVQILTNIVTNAIKYTDAGSVTIAATQEPDKVIIRVKDTGTGISADDQKKLFTPFTRVGNVDETKIVGTGLGMWITKQLVTILHGTIGVESIKGTGTHIVITFNTDRN